MKILLLAVVFTCTLFGELLSTTIIEVEKDEAVIQNNALQVGMSGFVVHRLAPDRTVIVQGVRVKSIEGTRAKLSLTPFSLFVNNNLPRYEHGAQKGDMVVLAFGYNRGLIIAPNEEIFYTLKKALKGEVIIHPDVFTTFLSYKGHPSPLKEDFTAFSDNITLGLLFFFIEQKLYTVDSHSFTILGIQDAPLKQQSTQKPFYARIKEIDANWFGEGSDEIEDYEAYYYGLLLEYNPKNTQLITAIKQSKNIHVQELAQDELEE